LSRIKILKKLAASTNWSSFAADAPLIIVVVAEKTKSREWLEDASFEEEKVHRERW